MEFRCFVFKKQENVQVINGFSTHLAVGRICRRFRIRMASRRCGEDAKKGFKMLRQLALINEQDPCLSENSEDSGMAALLFYFPTRHGFQLHVNSNLEKFRSLKFASQGFVCKAEFAPHADSQNKPGLNTFPWVRRRIMQLKRNNLMEISVATLL